MTAFPYLSHTGFLGAAEAAPGHPFAVAGICWDGSVTNRPGARFGPRAIRTASHMLCDATHPYFDVSPTPFVGDAGDLALPNTGLEGMRAALPAQVAPLIAAHRMAWLGGDHSITLPLLRAYRAHYGRPLAVVHFDAHCDTWTDHFGEPSGHGTWVYEAIQEGLVVRESDAADRRSFKVSLTASGRQAFERVAAVHEGWVVELLAGLGIDQKHQLHELLGRLRLHLAQPAEEKT